MVTPPVSFVAQLFQHLPVSVRESLLGPGQDGRGGLVAEVLDDLMRQLERSARAPLMEAERRQALQRALARGLGLSLQRWHPRTSEPVELERLRSWMRELPVSKELKVLLQCGPDSQLNMKLLCEEMAASELSGDQIGQQDGEAWLRLLVTGFYEGASSEQVLHPVLDLSAMRQLAERMGVILPPPGEVDDLNVRIEYLRGLLQRIDGGEDRKKLLEEMRRLLGALGTSNHVQQQTTYQAVREALDRAGFSSDGDSMGKDVEGDESVSWKHQLEEIRELLGQLHQRLDEKLVGPSTIELEAMETVYRKRVRDLFERLTFQGISPSGRPLSLPLEDVYVHLNVMAEVADSADQYSAAERRLLYEVEEWGGLDAERGRQLDALRYQRWKQQGRHEQSRTQRRFIESSAIELGRPGMVILGDPGSGKTTLLRYLAIRAALTGLHKNDGQHGRWLPIFVPLAAYDEHLRRGGDTKTLGEFLAFYYDRWRDLPGLEPLFQRALEEGRALVLLDGLDEVLHVTTRQHVAQKVWGLVQRWGERGNRFVLSSRIIGYREVQLPGELPHFTVLDFGHEEIQQFARKWCEAFEIWSAGRNSSVALQRAQQEEQKLLADVESNASVAHLASNPLLLTMLALLRRQVSRLPDRRIELYERYIRVLLDNREVSRSEGARQQGLDRFDTIASIQHLTDLALWLQENRSSGTARQQDLVRVMAEMALRREQKVENATAREREEAERRATHCFLDVRDIAGLIAERGHDAYGFLHLTFQEYFVGRALAREKAEERWRRIVPHVHNPRWREAILLCAGQLGVQEQRKDEVDELLRRILDAGSEYEAILHRDLFLATAVVADDVSSSSKLLDDLMTRLEDLRFSPVISIRRQALSGLAQLVRLGHEGARQRLLAWLLEKKNLQETMYAVGGITGEKGCEELRRELLRLLADEDSEVRRGAAMALGEAAERDAQVREALLKLLDDEDPEVKGGAAMALGEAAERDAQVREALLKLLDDEDPEVRSRGIMALGEAAARDTQVREALLKLLESEDSSARSTVAMSLGEAAERDAEVREALLKLLEDEELGVRVVVAITLKGAAERNAEVREALLKLLEGGESWMSGVVVIALEGAARSNAQVREALLKLLDVKDSSVRSGAAEALGSVVGSNAQVREALLKLLDVKDSSVRSRAAVVLGDAAERDVQVREALLKLLEDEDSEVRSGAAMALKGAARSDVQVRDALLKLLENQDSEARGRIAIALKGAAERDVQVRDALLKLLEDEDSEVRRGATVALGGAATSDVQAQGALMALLEDKDSEVRSGAAMALGGAAGGDAQVREALLKLLADKHSGVRRGAATALGGVAAIDAQVREALLKLLADKDSGVRTGAVEALRSAVESDAQVREALLKLLEDEDSDVRSKAAEALRGAAGSDAQMREALLKLLEDEDSVVRSGATEALGGTAGSDAQVRGALLKLLEDKASGVRTGAAKALGGAVGSDAQVREALLKLLDDKSYQVRAAAVLGLSRLRDEKSNLGELLLPWLGAVSNKFSEVHETRHSVAGYIAHQALQDEHLMVRLAEMLKRPEWVMREGSAMALMAMPEGPPSHLRPALIGLLDDSRNEGVWYGRQRVAMALLNVNDRIMSEKALGCVVQALDYGLQPWFDPDVSAPIRNEAARSLGQLEPVYRNNNVLQRTLRLLQEDPDEFVRDTAYETALRLLATPIKHSEPFKTTNLRGRVNVKNASILHLSDLHFGTREQAEVWCSQITHDLVHELKCKSLDGIVFSGDITNVSSQDEYDAACLFINKLMSNFGVSSQGVVLVPGNHDLCWKESRKAYSLVRVEAGMELPKREVFIQKSPDVIDVRDEGMYIRRFERFAAFHERITGRSYPLAADEQGVLYHFPTLNLLFLGLNSAWELDHHFKTRASIPRLMLSRALDRISADEAEYRHCIKVAVWHHPLVGSEDDRIKDHDFLDRLAAADFRLVLHGHIHKTENALFQYDRIVGGRRLEIVSAGTFGAPVREWQQGYPLQYNLLRFERSQLTVETRRREKLDGAWQPDARWLQGSGKDPKPRYTLDLA